MTRWSVTLGIFVMLGVFLFGVGRARADERVDVALVLAVDASGSISDDDRQLQREGYAEAIESREVVGAVLSGPTRRIAVVMFEWGGPSEQVIVIGWRIIDGPETAAETAAAIRGAPKNSLGMTSISTALRFAGQLLTSAPPAERRVIDVSGDGPENWTQAVEVERDRLVADGVTINGLPILGDSSAGFYKMDDYYAAHVIGGDGSFLIPAHGFDDFARAVRAKLMTEVAGTMPPGPTNYAMMGAK